MMISYMLNNTFLLRLSPYLAVGIVLLLAVLVIYRQFVPGKRQVGSGCCGPGDVTDETGHSDETVSQAKKNVQQEIPLCSSCKGCRVKNCPSLGLAGESGKERHGGGTSPNPFQ